MKFRFYINEDSNFLSGYKPGDRLTLAYEGDLDNIPVASWTTGERMVINNPVEAREGLFYIFNMEHPADYNNRSMSCGDVVVFDTVAYSCEACGWSEVVLEGVAQ